MIKVGIIGFGFMGRTHFSNYKTHDDVVITAICDIEKDRLLGSTEVTGNIAGSDNQLDLSGIALYTDYKEMLKKSHLDAISVTVPTYLHKEITIKALRKGLNVMCEKPMALSIPDCKKMIEAADKSGKILQIGHCIRFWPGYDITKEIIESGTYGRVQAATFQRLSLTPSWAWKNWILDGVKSGGASLDMHIHDSDFVHYLFGMPVSVRSFANIGVSSDFDHIVTNYIYNHKAVITSEGGWMMAPGFGFEMSFNIVLEKATIVFDITKNPSFKICKESGETVIPELKKGDGYSLEIDHFIKSVRGESVRKITTPKQSLDSLALVLAEKSSARKNKEIILK